MANVRQRTITYPGLANTYTFAEEAADFDASAVYSAGDYVIYAGDLYRITADHAAGDSWANTSKTKTNSTDEIKRVEAKEDGAVSELKSAITNSVNSLDKGLLYIPGTFVIGTISGSGNLTVDNTKANVISTTALKFSRPIRLSIKSGYRFVVHYYTSATMNSTTWESDKYSGAWITTYVDIAANQYFDVVINKSGVTSPDADVYASQLYINTLFETEIIQCQNDIAELQDGASVVADIQTRLNALEKDYLLTLPLVIGGLHTDPFEVDTENTKRIVTNQIISPTQTDLTITCDTGYEVYVSYYYDNNEHMSNSGWVTSITLINDRKFAFVARKATSEVALDSVNDILQHLSSNASVGTIPDIEAEVKNGLPYPDYVEDEMQSVLAEAYSNFVDGLIVFGFNTDQHVTYGTINAEKVVYGLQALSRLTRYIPFNLIALGGDAAGYQYDDGGVDSTQLGIIKDVTLVSSPLYDALCPVVSLTGNHDAYQNAAGQTDPLTGTQIFNTYLKRAVIAKQVHNRDKVSTDCYIDDDTCNIRFVFIDDTDSSNPDYNDRVRTWLSTALSTIPDNYQAIVISHRAQNDDLNSDFSGTRPNQDILNDYASDIICCVNGHAHKDASEYLDGILYIQTTCAMAGPNASDGYTRTFGTAAETAFDIFMVDTVAKKIYAVRYGAGNSREFIYEGEDAGEVIE